MLKKILGTIGSRYLIAFLNLALIFINAKVLGIEGVGMIGLIVASVNIAVIVNGILCGNTIVYFMNRYSMRTIFLPCISVDTYRLFPSLRLYVSYRAFTNPAIDWISSCWRS